MVEVTGVEPVSNNQQHNKELQALLTLYSIRSNQQTLGQRCQNNHSSAPSDKIHWNLSESST